MTVIYAEKHSLAKAIAEALGAGRRIPHPKEPSIAHWEFDFGGSPAVICHGTGHLANLIPAKEYDDKFKSWKLDIYPCIPDTFQKIAKQQTLTCFKYVKAFFEKADLISNATDPDREGELIFGYVYELAKCDKPWKRVWLEDLTDEKIKRAFQNLREGEAMLPMQMAGRARDISDWLIGCNLTVAMTAKFGGRDNLLSVGRVQTPTLALVVNREKAITGHIKTPFWKLIGVFSTPAGKLEAEYCEGSFQKKEKATEIFNLCLGKSGIVKSKKAKQKAESAPLLYNATQLQIAASKKFGWGADKTASVMQSLYEKKLTTYPRTSSEHLTQAMIPEVAETILKLMQLTEYSQYSIPKEQWQEFSSRHFDDKKVGSHTAIIPTTSVPHNLSALSEDEKQLYDLLVKSVIRIVYPKAVLEETSAELEVNGITFKASGCVICSTGWYAVDAMPEKKKGQLPNISEGDKLIGEYSLKEGVTEPPKRYTEADLLAAMELAGQNLEDEEARTLMKMQKKGLGTDATRAPIIKSLFERGYIEKKGKSIVPTEKGAYIIDTLPVDDLKSAYITGEWEKRLNDIAQGDADYNLFIRDICNTTRKWYNQIAESKSEMYISENQRKLICPACGKPLRKLQWGYSCSGYIKDGSGCCFSINSEICSKKITESQLLMLITSDKTGIIKGFKSKAGKAFDAALKLNRDSMKIEFEFVSDSKKKR